MGIVVITPSYITTQKETYNYGIDTMNVRKMWEKSITGKNINVAVIDSGCDVEHEELKGAIIGTRNFTEDDNGDIHTVTDYTGHGTHVSGIIGNRNIKSLIGIAPESNLLILKVIGKNGAGSFDSLIEAIHYALEWRGLDNSKIDVINMSLGSPQDDPKLREAVNEAIKNNIVIVAAAGNEGDGLEDTIEISYPGYYKDVFEIGATDINNVPTGFTNSNSNVDFVAPGRDIYSTFPNNKYATLSGTSMATPQVTGIVALIKDEYRQEGLEISNITVTDYLNQTSEFLPGYSVNLQGFGLVKI
jgi:major intracellular serine protease